MGPDTTEPTEQQAAQSRWLIEEAERLRAELSDTLLLYKEATEHGLRWMNEAASLRVDLAEAKADAERYQTVRRMHAQAFAEAYRLSINTGKPFDEIIDESRPFYFSSAASQEGQS